MLSKYPILAGCLGLSALVLFLLHPTQAGLLAPAGICPPVSNTLKYTIVYGAVTVSGQAAPVGAVVDAGSPRGDVVGCFIVATAGEYGAMFVYGEDNSVNPPIPGMKNGETIAFRVNGVTATADPALPWADDKTAHMVNLSASAAPCMPEDVVPDGRIDAQDIQRVSAAWRQDLVTTTCPVCDVDGNGAINIRDVQRVAYKWNTSCGGQ